MRIIQFNTQEEAEGDLLILPLFENESISPFAEKLDTQIQGGLRFNLENEKFSGKREELVWITTNGLFHIPKILVVGLGKREDAHLQEIGGFLASHTAAVSRLVVDGTSLSVHPLLFGLLLKEWRFDTYISEKKKSASSLQCLSSTPEKEKEGFAAWHALLQGVITARTLTSEPANRLYPEAFAERCLSMQKLGIEVEILDEKALEAIGAHALLAVNAGSARAPRLVILKWNGGNAPIVLVGKGVSFDSGGINIKTTDEITEMKMDKAAAATVTGVLQTAALLQLPVTLYGVLGLVENMPDGRAMKPGDILDTLSGKTVEVIDTDNEGRLVLADCLTYAQKYLSPHILIDLGTLTLETMGALASEYAALFCPDDTLSSQLIEAGRRSGEKLWPLPLGEFFAKQIRSTSADLKNMGQLNFGESSACAEFLRSFVRPDLLWAHIDIAGVACLKEEATGFGVQLLINWLSRE